MLHGISYGSKVGPTYLDKPSDPGGSISDYGELIVQGDTISKCNYPQN